LGDRLQNSEIKEERIMSKLYSWQMKTAAFLVCIIAFGTAVFFLYDALEKYEGVYQFDDNFESSRYVNNDLEAMGSKLYWDWRNESINMSLFEDYDFEIINLQNEVVLKSDRQPESSKSLNFSDASVRISLSEQRENDVYVTWNRERYTVTYTAWMLLVCGILSLACLIYLLVVSGRREKDADVRLYAIDSLPVEISLLLIFALLALGAGSGVFLALTAIRGNNSFVPPAAYLTAIFGSAAIVAILQSVSRSIKAGIASKNSLVRKAVSLLKKILRRVFNMVKEDKIFENTAPHRKVFVFFLIYSAAIIVTTLWENPIILIAIMISSYVFIKREVNSFVELKTGVEKIRQGDLEYRIENIQSGMFSQIAEDVNYIGEGLEKSLDDKVRAERMKSELITNVSHDLKTPLTSIISYTELLSKMELTPEEANDYVKIIGKKSERLKNLTADLFDYSKVQSGNADIVKEKIDLSLLVRQCLAENEEAIKESGLTFVTDMPESEITLGDGKKLSRVLENLIGNALKYSLSGTRVYVSVNKGKIEVKNVANYVMTFDENEITERFVRGDDARSGEGSGLGLAIAKSYVEAMGGEFFVKRDGDLFKAVINIDK
jgi:signal transduction histidine kinase